MPELSVLSVIDDNSIRVSAPKMSVPWNPIVNVPTTKGMKEPSNGRATKITLDGTWQVESMGGIEYLEAAGQAIYGPKPGSIAILVRIDNAVVRQQRAAYLASKKNPPKSN